MRDFIFGSELKYYNNGYGKVAVLLEPYELHPEDYIKAASMDFDAVLCNHKRFVERYDNWLWYPLGGTFIDEQDWNIYEKKDGISMFISNKDTMPGHKLRHKILREFKDDEIDFYGLAVNNYVGKKIDGLRDYRFSIVIESCRERGYFTEKIIDCFLTGTIPIYWGDPDIGDIFDLDGIVLFNDLDETLRLTSTYSIYSKYLYDTALSAVRANFQTAKKYANYKENIKRIYEGIIE